MRYSYCSNNRGTSSRVASDPAACHRRRVGHVKCKTYCTTPTAHISALFELLFFCAVFALQNMPPELPPELPAERHHVFLDVLAVVLTHFFDGDNEPRCPAMTNLQLASLETCRIYRSVALVDLRVMANTPRYLWNQQVKAGAFDDRIARPRIRDMRWHLSSHFLPKRCDKRRSSLVRAVRGLGQLIPGRRVLVTAGKLMWPDSVQRLTLRFDEYPQEVSKRSSFNEPLENIVWPESLQQLRFGHIFNRPI